MPEAEYVVGQPLVVEAEFRLNGVARDPSLVRCYVRPPTGMLRELVFPSVALLRTEEGVYEAQVTPDEPGTWGFRFVGTGAVEGVGEGTRNVRRSQVI